MDGCVRIGLTPGLAVHVVRARANGCVVRAACGGDFTKVAKQVIVGFCYIRHSILYAEIIREWNELIC